MRAEYPFSAVVAQDELKLALLLSANVINLGADIGAMGSALKLLVGGPAPGHLYSFKQLLYDAAQRHDPVDPLAGESGFELIQSHAIRYPLALRGPEQVANLLLMTPYFWSADRTTRDRLAALDHLDTEVDVVVHAYRRTAEASVG